MACLLTSVSPGLALPPQIKLRLSLVSSIQSSKGKACVKFKEFLESRSQHKFDVELYSDGKLFHDREELEALQLGAVDMVVASFSKFDAIDVPEISVFGMPFLFRDLREAHAIADGPVGREILNILEPKGIKGLAIWDLGFYQFHSNRAVREPSDLKGLKFKVIRGKVFEAIAKALQTRPVLLPRGSGISDGYGKHLVESGMSPPAIFYGDGVTAVQKHLIAVSSSFHGYVVGLGLKFWNSLSGSDQALVQQALVDATKFERDLTLQEDQVALQSLKKESKTQVYFPTEPELNKWKAVLLPVSESFKAQREGAFLQRVQSALEALRK